MGSSTKYEPLAQKEGSVNGHHHKTHDPKSLVNAAAAKLGSEVVSDATKHAYNGAAYWIMLLQGFGLLLSWNVLLNA
jgi:hypothetical protein